MCHTESLLLDRVREFEAPIEKPPRDPVRTVALPQKSFIPELLRFHATITAYVDYAFVNCLVRNVRP